MSRQSPNRIGQLNGPWSVLLRLALASYPLVLSWAVWMTVHQFQDEAFRTSGERFTQLDGAKLKAEVLAAIAAAGTFPQEWRDRIIKIEGKQDDMMKALARIEVVLEKVQ